MFPTTVGVVWEDGVATKIVPDDTTGLGSLPAEISELGLVAGRRTDPFGFVSFPFSWRDGVYTALLPIPEQPPPTAMGFATAVNEWAQVLRTKITLDGGPASADGRAVVWRNGQIVATSDVQAFGVDINNTGSAAVQVVHSGSPSGTTAGLWRIGRGVTDLGTLGGTNSRSQAINEIGQVAGVSQTASGAEHAFVWRWGTTTDLGTLGGAWSVVGSNEPDPARAGSGDRAVNEWGHIVGTSQTVSGEEHAFLWRGGRMTDLGTLGGADSRATAINEWGQVVGESQTASGIWHAFLWQHGEMTDIGALVTDQRSWARDINNHSQIVGLDGFGAVLWTIQP